MVSRGYLRVDLVHQGDFDGIKGLYVINRVDVVTQFEVVVAVVRISEHFLIPALRRTMAAFPFVLRGFHSDNVLTVEPSTELQAKAA